jgi:hypothetical protein
MKIWRYIEGFDNYRISNNGEVLSLNFKRSGKPKILKATINGDGYYNVTLRKDNKSYNKTIHVLVALAFVKGYTVGLQVNHKDGIKTNNNYTNLEWVTSGDNTRHMVKMGLRNTSKNACKE